MAVGKLIPSAAILAAFIVLAAIPTGTDAASMTEMYEYVNNDFYADLGVPATATKAEIKKAYRKLSLTYHPDKSDAADAADKFRVISRAYEVLKDDKTRKSYDAFIDSLPPAMHPRNRAKRVPAWIVLTGLALTITALEWWARQSKYKKRVNDPRYLALVAQAHEQGRSIQEFGAPSPFDLFIFQFPFYPFYIGRFLVVQTYHGLTELKNIPQWWAQHKEQMAHERKLEEVALKMAREKAKEEVKDEEFKSKNTGVTATSAMKKQDEKHKKKLKDYRSSLMRRIQRNWDDLLPPPEQDDAKAIAELMGYKKLNDLAVDLATSKDKQAVAKKVDIAVLEMVAELVAVAEADMSEMESGAESGIESGAETDATDGEGASDE